jgi:hypothetical protein
MIDTTTDKYSLESVKEFAHTIDGIYVDYTSEKFAVIVPLQKSKRIQRVFGLLNKKKNKLEFNSIVCPKDKANFEQLTAAQTEFTYSKFTIDGDNVMISASLNLDTLHDDSMREAIMEVAKNADNWEKNLTGLDVY